MNLHSLSVALMVNNTKDGLFEIAILYGLAIQNFPRLKEDQLVQMMEIGSH